MSEFRQSIYKEAIHKADETINAYRGQKPPSASEIARAALTAVLGQPEQVTQNRWYRPHFGKVVAYVKRRLADKRQEEAETMREADALSVGSLMRVRHLATSIPLAERLREDLWGSTAPLFPTADDERLWSALEQVTAWIKDSAETAFYEQAFVVEGSPDSPDKKQVSQSLIRPLALPARNAYGDIILKRSPSTRRAYDLTFAANRLTKAGDWWEPEAAAVYLTTGVFLRWGLPRYVTTGRAVVTGEKFRGQVTLTVHDVESVPPDEVAKRYAQMRQRLSSSARPAIDLRAGKPTGYSTEVLAQLELDLIYYEAKQRTLQGKKVHPKRWAWRPTPRQLHEVWEARATEFGYGAHVADSPQNIANKQRRNVTLGLYASALNALASDEEHEEVADEVDARVRAAFKRS